MKLAIAGAAALLLQTIPSIPFAQDDLLHDEVAQRWLKRNGVEAPKNFPDLLERSFAHLAVGVFDVYLPVSCLQDGKALKEVGAALQALSDAQHAFAGWVRGAADEKRKDDPLAKWFDSLSPRALNGKNLGGADLAEAAGADEAVRTALAEFAATQRTGAPLGVERPLAGIPLVVLPRRAEFVELTCVVGALLPNQRASAWSEGITTWLEYQAEGIPLLTLEYAATPDGDYSKGISVGERNPAALKQLVAQVASRALLGRLYSDGLDPALCSGMANALVIDLYGEIDTRIDGDVRTRSTQGSSAFVPGGNPDGGVLPPISAESRWRETRGKDHFVRILSQVQKQSGKKAPSRAEKLARFELQSDDGAKRELVTAPFLGPNAKKPGEEVFGDYLELVRCYGVAFLQWLRIEGASQPAESGARFAELLRTLGRGAKTENLPDILHEIYGQPLSGPSVHALFDGATLEGRFLAWLSRQA